MTCTVEYFSHKFMKSFIFAKIKTLNLNIFVIEKGALFLVLVNKIEESQSTCTYISVRNDDGALNEPFRWCL